MKTEIIRYMPRYTRSKWRLVTTQTTASTTYRSNLMVLMARCKENTIREMLNIKDK
jgi:hypothetical protein